MNKANKLAADCKSRRSYYKSDKRFLVPPRHWISAFRKRTIRRMERRVNKMLCMVEG